MKEFVKKGLSFILDKISTRTLVYPQILTLSQNQLLVGRTALVTGGTSGIGYEIARTFLNAGANVIITGRDLERNLSVVEKLKETTGNNNVYSIQLDIINISKFQNSLEEAINLVKKPLDILINNAGTLGGQDDRQIDFHTIMDTNLTGAFFLTEIFSSYMIRNGIKGNILFVASSSSLRPAVNAYTLSKWGIRGLTLGMAKKLIKYGIVVNGIAPGPTSTPMMKKNSGSDLSLPTNPSGRYTTPQEVANISLILVSGMGRQIVGDIIYISGGAGVITYDDIQY